MEAKRSKVSDIDETQEPLRKLYSPPCLTVHGTVQEITGSGGETPSDVDKGTS